MSLLEVMISLMLMSLVLSFSLLSFTNLSQARQNLNCSLLLMMANNLTERLSVNVLNPAIEIQQWRDLSKPLLRQVVDKIDCQKQRCNFHLVLVNCPVIDWQVTRTDPI